MGNDRHPDDDNRRTGSVHRRATGQRSRFQSLVGSSPDGPDIRGSAAGVNPDNGHYLSNPGHRASESRYRDGHRRRAAQRGEVSVHVRPMAAAGPVYFRSFAPEETGRSLRPNSHPPGDCQFRRHGYERAVRVFSRGPGHGTGGADFAHPAGPVLGANLHPAVFFKPGATGETIGAGCQPVGVDEALPSVGSQPPNFSLAGKLAHPRVSRKRHRSLPSLAGNPLAGRHHTGFGGAGLHAISARPGHPRTVGHCQPVQ